MRQILYASDDGRFRVVRLAVCASADSGTYTGTDIIARGRIAKVVEGDEMTVHGSFQLDANEQPVRDARTGKLKFLVERADYRDAVTGEGVARTLCGLVPGLGPATSKQVVLGLGGPVRALETLSGDKDAAYAALCALDIRNGHPFLWQALVDAWAERQSEREQEATLADLGLPAWLRTKVREVYKGDGFRLVREDPYRMMYDIDGVGFATADDIAQKLGVQKTDAKRAEACLVFLLHEFAYGEGHTCVSAKYLMSEAERKLGGSADDGLARALDGHRVQVLESQSGPTKGQEFAALSKFVDHESFLADRVRAWTKTSVPSPGATSVSDGPSEMHRWTKPGEGPGGYVAHERAEEREVLLACAGVPEDVVDELLCDDALLERVFAEHERETGHALDAVQREAVRLAVTEQVCVVTGGPGTGKSEVSRAILRALLALGLEDGEVGLGAPTGRAAKRLAESTGRPASTLHRLLGYGQSEDPKFRYAYNAYNKLPYRAVLVDESSMVDSELMHALLSAIDDESTRVIFVGDKDQLPPVGPGAPFRDFLSVGKLPTVRLTKIFRQAQDSKIVTSAHRILEGKSPVVSPHGSRNEGAVFFVHSEDPVQAAQLISDIVSKSIPEQFKIDSKDIQVLVPMHKSEVGTTALNAKLQASINPHAQNEFARSVKSGERVFYVGDRVRQTKNDYKREIVNGDLGFVEEVFDKYQNPAPEEQREAVLSVRLEDTGKIFYCKKCDLQQLQLAYAGSVHSSQGGEYPAVVLCLMKNHWIMLTRTLFYTALTRAKRLCILVGDKVAFERAYKNDKSVDRLTLLSKFYLVKENAI